MDLRCQMFDLYPNIIISKITHRTSDIFLYPPILNLVLNRLGIKFPIAGC